MTSPLQRVVVVGQTHAPPPQVSPAPPQLVPATKLVPSQVSMTSPLHCLVPTVHPPPTQLPPEQVWLLTAQSVPRVQEPPEQV